MKIDKIIKKRLRIRNKLINFNTNNRLRLTVNRSSKNISAQIIDDIKDKTLVAASSLEKDIRKINKTKKSDLSLFVGETLAKRANEKNITKVYFDRGCYKYHGRVKLLADALRKNGLEF
jgi:large subunit ribosomal protein L18